MDSDQKLIARKLFRLRVHEAKAAEYQRLFEKVMQYRDRNFVPIRPYGNIGDRKNDGYIPATGTYFQVYAPEDPRGRNPTKAAAKAAEDLAGLVKHWDRTTPIQVFRFVYNDAYRGSTPPLEEALGRIRKEYSIDARALLAKDLEEEVLQLSEDALADVINGPIPRPDLWPSVDFSILREVVNHVLTTKEPLSTTSLLKVPDFEGKIQFNGLTHHVATLLKVGSYQNEAIADYFSTNATFARQQLRDHLAGLYLESRHKISDAVADVQEIGDLVFFDILTSLTPTKLPQAQRASAQEAAIIVMAYYFEACDVFEDPDASS